RPRFGMLRGADARPDRSGYEVPIGLVTAPAYRGDSTSQLLLLAEHSDLSGETLDCARVGDIDLPGFSSLIEVLHLSATKRRDHSKAKQQMLNLARHALARGRVAELRLSRCKHRGPSVCRKEPVQEQCNLFLRQCKYNS